MNSEKSSAKQIMQPEPARDMSSSSQRAASPARWIVSLGFALHPTPLDWVLYLIAGVLAFRDESELLLVLAAMILQWMNAHRYK